MNIKNIAIPVIGIGVVITGALLKSNSRAVSDVAKDVLKTTPEPIETFGGVPLSKLNELAKDIYHGISCTIDKWGFLIFHYKSKRGHQLFHSQMEIDATNKLVNLFHGHYRECK